MIHRLQAQSYALCLFRWMTYQTLFFPFLSSGITSINLFFMFRETYRTYEIIWIMGTSNNTKAITIIIFLLTYYELKKHRFGNLWKYNHIKDAYLNICVLTKNDPKTFRVIHRQRLKDEKTKMDMHKSTLSLNSQDSLKGD